MTLALCETRVLRNINLTNGTIQLCDITIFYATNSGNVKRYIVTTIHIAKEKTLTMLFALREKKVVIGTFLTMKDEYKMDLKRSEMPLRIGMPSGSTQNVVCIPFNLSFSRRSVLCIKGRLTRLR